MRGFRFSSPETSRASISLCIHTIKDKPMIRSLAFAAMLSNLCAVPVWADKAVETTISGIYKDRADLAGKQVRVHGEVVKVNNHIMKRNFLHIQDGTEDAADGSNDLTLTSQDTAKPGEQITVVGTVVLDHDFGAGYRYPILVEDATIAAGD